MLKVPIEVLLSARLFVYPKTWQDKLFFISNMGQGGHFLSDVVFAAIAVLFLWAFPERFERNLSEHPKTLVQINKL